MTLYARVDIEIDHMTLGLDIFTLYSRRNRIIVVNNAMYAVKNFFLNRDRLNSVLQVTDRYYRETIATRWK